MITCYYNLALSEEALRAFLIKIQCYQDNVGVCKGQNALKGSEGRLDAAEAFGEESY